MANQLAEGAINILLNFATDDARAQKGTRQLNGVTKGLKELETRSKSAGNRISDFANRMDKASIILGIGGIVLKRAGEEMLKFAAGPVKAAAEIEAAMAQVRRTTKLGDEAVSELTTAFGKLTGEIPLSVTQLSQIASALGQLGVTAGKTEKEIVPLLTNMSKLIGEFSAVADISFEEATLAVGRLSKAFPESVNEAGDLMKFASQLTNVINELGNTTAASAQQIVQGMLRASSAAATLGLRAQELAALNAILVQMGFQAAQSGTLLKTAFIKIAKNADELAAQMGVIVTDDTFKDLANMEIFFKQIDKAMQAMGKTAAVAKLSGIVDIRAFAVLEKLASSTRQVGDAQSEFARVMQTVNTQMAEQTSVQAELERIMNTLQNAITRLKNTWTAFSASFGEPFLKPLALVIRGMTKLIQIFMLLPRPIKAAIGLLVGTLTALVGVTLLAAGTISALTSTVIFVATNFARWKEIAATLALELKGLTAVNTALGVSNMAVGKSIAVQSGAHKAWLASLIASRNHQRALSRDMALSKGARMKAADSWHLLSGAVNSNRKPTQRWINTMAEATQQTKNGQVPLGGLTSQLYGVKSASTEVTAGTLGLTRANALAGRRMNSYSKGAGKAMGKLAGMTKVQLFAMMSVTELGSAIKVGVLNNLKKLLPILPKIVNGFKIFAKVFWKVGVIIAAVVFAVKLLSAAFKAVKDEFSDVTFQGTAIAELWKYIKMGAVGLFKAVIFVLGGIIKIVAGLVRALAALVKWTLLAFGILKRKDPNAQLGKSAEMAAKNQAALNSELDKTNTNLSNIGNKFQRFILPGSAPISAAGPTTTSPAAATGAALPAATSPGTLGGGQNITFNFSIGPGNNISEGDLRSVLGDFLIQMSESGAQGLIGQPATV